MKKYQVNCVCSTPCFVEVEAESEEEALRKDREGVDEGEVLINESGESVYGDFCIA